MVLLASKSPNSADGGARPTAKGSPIPKDLTTSIRFGFLIHDVSRLRRVVIDRALKPVGITRSQWWVLSFLGRRDGMTQTALAAELDLTKVAIGGLLDRMENSAFVERRPDQRDGRIKRVYLTPPGTRFLGMIRANIQGVERDILADIDEAALQVTTDTMLQIKQTLQAMVVGNENENQG